MRKDLARQLTQQPHLLRLLKLLEYGVNALASLVPNGAQSVACHSSSNSARQIGHNKAHRTTTDTSHNRPERLCRLIVILCQTFIPHHLLKHATKLLIRVPIRILLVLRLPAKAKRRPWETTRETSGTWLRSWNLFVGVGLCRSLCSAAKAVE